MSASPTSTPSRLRSFLHRFQVKKDALMRHIPYPFIIGKRTGTSNGADESDTRRDSEDLAQQSGYSGEVNVERQSLDQNDCE